MKTYFRWTTAVALLICACCKSAEAQTDSTTNKLQFSAFGETYFGWDHRPGQDQNRPPFVYSYNRTREFNINLAFVKAAYNVDNLRASLALMTGTYANANLASEPGVLKNIYEANAGVKLTKPRNLWLDAGVFSSHIGFESAHSPDCWTLTRSMVADNSPYYESGLRLSYTDRDQHWYFAGLLVNGWQHIQRPAGQTFPGLGHQITYKSNEQWLVNSSSFFGSETPDTARLFRLYHNFYLQWKPSRKWGVILGFDFGFQQAVPDSSFWNSWYTPVAILRYAISRRSAVAARAEYFSDPHAVVIVTGTPATFRTQSYSCNFDYSLNDQVMWRTEARFFKSREKIFVSGKGFSDQNLMLTGSLLFSIH